MRGFVGWSGAVTALSLLVAGPVSAHGLDANLADVRLAGDTVYIVASPGVAALARFDDDENGLLRVDEVARHRPELLAWFAQSFRVANERAQRGTVIFEDVSTPHAFDGTEPDGASHLRFTFRYRFAAPPTALRVQWHAAGQEPLRVSATRVKAEKLLPAQEPLGPTTTVRLEALRPAEVFFGAMEPVAEREAAAPGAKPPWVWILVLAVALGAMVVVVRKLASDAGEHH